MKVGPIIQGKYLHWNVGPHMHFTNHINLANFLYTFNYFEWTALPEFECYICKIFTLLPTDTECWRSQVLTPPNRKSTRDSGLMGSCTASAFTGNQMLHHRTQGHWFIRPKGLHMSYVFHLLLSMLFILLKLILLILVGARSSRP